MMNVTRFEISGPLLLEPKVFPDARGYFSETFNSKIFESLGLPTLWVQDNRSLSKPHVLRGLHAQHSPWQVKLVQATRGRIIDVAVDIRPQSATFGKYVRVELSAERPALFFVPAGFAHGFMVVGEEEAEVIYKVTELYNPAHEIGILWSDPDLAIRWPAEHPLVSEKDNRLPRLRDLKSLLEKWT